MSKLIGGYGLGSPYVCNTHGATPASPSAATLRAQERARALTGAAGVQALGEALHVCGPWECYAGSGLSCTVCHRPHPDSWAARCRGGHR